MRYSALIILLILLSFFSTNLWAAFTVNANQVIQTGTDTDLSGLNVAGISIINQAGITVYDIGDRTLYVRGNLTINPETETLIIGRFSGELLIVDNSGQLTIGSQITSNGFTRYSEGEAIFLRDTDPGFTNRVSFYDNATFTWNGGVISQYAGKFGFYGDNVTVNINSEKAVLIYRTSDPQNQIRQETDNFTSRAFTFINGDLTIVGTGQQLNGYSPVHASGAIAFSGLTPNEDVILRGYAGGDQGNVDVKFWAGGRPVLYNAQYGSQLRAGPHISGNGASYGVALVYQDFSINYKDQLGQAIEGVRFIMRDYDNGNRETYNQEGHLVNNEQDFIYRQISDATGTTNTVSLLLAANVANSGNSDAPNTGNYTWDYRGKNGDDTDRFDVHHWAYGFDYLPAFDVEFKGVEEKKLSYVLIKDQNITTPTLSQAQMISGITIAHDADKAIGSISINETITLCDLYDFIMADKMDHLDQPAYERALVEVVQDTLFIGKYQLNFQAGAALQPCDKFSRIVTDTTTIFNDIDQNLQVSLQDSDENYKLISLLGIQSADVNVTDNNTSSSLFSGTDFTGEVYIVTQSSSDNVSAIVTKEGYSNWGADFDLTTGDVFKYYVSNSATAGNPCTLSNQELELYLLRKVLAKNENIMNTVASGNTVEIALNQITADDPNKCLLEKQEEIIFLLQKIIAKSERIIGHLEK